MNFTPRDKKIIEGEFLIANKQGEIIPFRFNHIQNKIFNEMSHYNLILKPRKKGVSTLIGSLCLHKCMTEPNVYTVLISHEDKATKRLFSRTKNIINRLSRPVKLSEESANELGFMETGSKYWIGTAGQKALCRGDDVHILHPSEPPYYQDQTILDGAYESVPEGGYIFNEFTANGCEKMYEMVMKSLKGENEWKLHFFPFYCDPEYTKPAPADFKRDGQEEQIVDWGKELGYNVTNDHLQWRRWKMSRMADPGVFPAEYPSCIEDAFLISGRVYFDKAQLGEYRKRYKPPHKVGHLEIIDRDIVLHQSEKGIFQFWEMPNPGRSYILALDTAEGIGGDFSVGLVLDRHSKDFIATLSCQYDPAKFAREAYILGKMYNNALIVPESNNHGGTVINELIHMNYPKLYMQTTINKATNEETETYGFRTTSITKPIIINHLAKYIRNGYSKIPDIRMITELSNFIIDEKGKLHAAGKGHDDLVIAGAIALWTNDNIENEPTQDELRRMKSDWRKKTGQSAEED